MYQTIFPIFYQILHSPSKEPTLHEPHFLPILLPKMLQPILEKLERLTLLLHELLLLLQSIVLQIQLFLLPEEVSSQYSHTSFDSFSFLKIFLLLFLLLLLFFTSLLFYYLFFFFFSLIASPSHHVLP